MVASSDERRLGLGPLVVPPQHFLEAEYRRRLSDSRGGGRRGRIESVRGDRLPFERARSVLGPEGLYSLETVHVPVLVVWPCTAMAGAEFKRATGERTPLANQKLAGSLKRFWDQKEKRRDARDSDQHQFVHNDHERTKVSLYVPATVLGTTRVMLRAG